MTSSPYHDLLAFATPPGCGTRAHFAAMAEAFRSLLSRDKTLVMLCPEVTPEGVLLLTCARQKESARRVAEPRVALATPATPHHQRKPRIRPPDGPRTPREAATKLGCSIKTLNAHVAAGELRYMIKGHGKKRPRKMFADADLDEFIANQTRKDSPCPSTASRARHIGTSIFSGTVIDFTAPRKPLTGGKQKK